MRIRTKIVRIRTHNTLIYCLSLPTSDDRKTIAFMEQLGKILIVDDNEDVLFALNLLLEPYAEKIKVAVTPDRIEYFMTTFQPDIILLDMNFSRDAISGQEGFESLEQILRIDSQAVVIFMTAYADTDKAVRAIKAGATDFIPKPWEKEKLLATLSSGIKLRRSRCEVNLLKEQVEVLSGAGSGVEESIIGESAAMQEVFATIEKLRDTDANILILGENGTGKDVIARLLYRCSPRYGRPFVTIDLGSIPEQLFESELFGYEKGAFTDASADRIGRFEMANKGTIFLDEIGDLDPSCQVKLLRVLQDQTFEVLGDSRPRKTDIRVVSATNADLRKMVSERTFREDLFYRINLITVKLPSLRERREDIPLLARHFADRQAEINGLPRTEFSADALNFLSRLPYPGNIRELKNLVERTILVSGKPTLDASDFDAQYLRPNEPVKASDASSLAGMTLDEIERQTILQALDRHKGNLSQVAMTLGISRAALYRRLEKFNITVTEK